MYFHNIFSPTRISTTLKKMLLKQYYEKGHYFGHGRPNLPHEVQHI